MTTARIYSYLPIALLALGPLYLSVNSLLLGMTAALVVCVVLSLNLLLMYPLRNLFPTPLRLLALLVANSTIIVVLQTLFQAHAFTLQQQLGIFFPLLCINGLVLSYAEGLFKSTTWNRPVKDLLILSIFIIVVMTVFGASRELLESYSLLADVSQLTGLELSGIRFIESDDGIPLFASAAGSLFLLGLLCALVSLVIPDVKQARRRE